MLQCWSDCKLGVKLSAAFALVMFVFVVAFGGSVYLNRKVEAAQNRQDTVLIPARANFKDVTAALFIARADGWYYVASVNRAKALLIWPSIAPTWASLEQGAGIGQVNTAIAQMDQVTQQNAALVEEVAAAAGSLQELVQSLVGTVACSRAAAAPPSRQLLGGRQNRLRRVDSAAQNVEPLVEAGTAALKCGLEALYIRGSVSPYEFKQRGR
jgi:hypothetical protein